MRGFSKKGTRAYRVGGLVKNVMILSVRTLWMPLYLAVPIRLDPIALPVVLILDKLRRP